MSSDGEVSGPQRVAAFLLSLKKEQAAEVLRHLEPRVVSEVAAAMTRLDDGCSDPETLKSLYLEIAKVVNGPKGVRSQSDAELSSMLDASLGQERARDVLEAIHARRRVEKPFEFLEKEEADRIAAVLEDEKPSVIALVLAHIDPNRSAEFLAVMDPDDALEVVRRVATLKTTGTDTVRSVVETLMRKLEALAALPESSDPSAGLKTIAEMLNFANQDVEQSVLEGLESENEQLAADIRDFMFTWTDLAEVDKRSMQKILASVDTRTLAVSLKGCPEAVESNIIQNLSSRVQEMVIDERDLAGSLPMQEVTAARNEVLKGVRALMDSGEFRPPRAGEELVS